MKPKDRARIKLADQLVAATTGSEAHGIAVRLRKLVEPPPTLREILMMVPAKSHSERMRKIGVTKQVYYAWMKEEWRPNTLSARRLAQLTGVSVDEIRGR